MRVLIVGAGALGGLVGSQFVESGEDVVLVEVNLARCKLLTETGLFVAEVGKEEKCVRVPIVSSVEGLEPFDLVFVAAKSYQTEVAVRAVLPVIQRSTWILSMQNGIGNAELIAGIANRDHVLCGITYHSIQHVGPNRLRYRPGIKPIQISPLDGAIGPEVIAIGESFRKAGLTTEVVENIDHVIWQKLLHNAVVNPVSALTGLTCRELLDDEDLQSFMADLCGEIVDVMRARGIPIVDEENPYRPVINSQKALGKNRPSMAQDLARGNCTEVDAINGAIVQEAIRLGLQAPHNKAIVHFIHSRERQKILKKQERPRAQATTGAGAPQHAHPTRRTPHGGMPVGRVPLRATPRLKEILRAYHVELQDADRDPSRQIAWCSSLGPVEIVRALGLMPFFPENHAALIGASRQTGKYIPRALAEGFSQFASSAMTSDIGAMLVGDSPLVSVYGIDGPPSPDLLVYNTNFGHDLTRWFEYYARRFQIPVLGLHPPAAIRDMDYVEIDAAVQQVLRLISEVERVANRKLDYDRLAEVVDLSARAARLWGETLDLASNVPAPLTYFDLLVHMAPMLLLRGTPQAIEYFQLLKSEIEERVENGVAAVPGERHRIYWEGPPIWCALRPLSELFLQHQAAVVGGTYCSVFALEGLDRNNPIATLARAYTGVFPNRSDDYKSAFLTSQFAEFGVDAVVYHEGRTSPAHSNVRYGLEVRLRKETGLPSLVLEADTHDLRLFSMDQIQKQLSDFIEDQDGATTMSAGRVRMDS